MIVGQQAHGSTQHFVDECVGWRSVYQILIWTETSASKLSLMPLAPTWWVSPKDMWNLSQRCVGLPVTRSSLASTPLCSELKAGLQVQADLRHSVHQLPLDQLVGTSVVWSTLVGCHLACWWEEMVEPVDSLQSHLQPGLACKLSPGQGPALSSRLPGINIVIKPF